MKKAVFVDFDGTITKVDTCDAMLKAFTGDGREEINRLWEEKKLSTEECANMIFRQFHACPEDIENLMGIIEIDGHFKEFLELCRARGHEVYVLSDGYDFNIKTVFKKHNINARYFANKLLYEPEKGFGIECIYRNESCGNCGTCKTNLIQALKRDCGQVVYIGDGYSDICPAAIADIVFAKGILFKLCAEKGINAINFSSFADIIASGLI